jgi:hypothetical protein
MKKYYVRVFNNDELEGRINDFLIRFNSYEKGTVYDIKHIIPQGNKTMVLFGKMN